MACARRTVMQLRHAIARIGIPVIFRLGTGGSTAQRLDIAVGIVGYSLFDEAVGAHSVDILLRLDQPGRPIIGKSVCVCFGIGAVLPLPFGDIAGIGRCRTFESRFVIVQLRFEQCVGSGADGMVRAPSLQIVFVGLDEQIGSHPLAAEFSQRVVCIGYSYRLVVVEGCFFGQ